MVHHRKRLPFRFETRDDLPRIHARLDDLERYRAADRLHLLCHKDNAHAAFTNLLQQLVGAYDVARSLKREILAEARRTITGHRFQELISPIAGLEKPHDSRAELGIVTALPVEKSVAVGAGRQFERV
jgi:hypothetical protein